MTISITMNESNEIIMILNGCHHKNTCLSNGCCQFEKFVSKMDIYKPNAIARLYLHLVMGRESKINDILKQYEEYFVDGKNINENGIEYLKKLILEDHGIQRISVFSLCIFNLVKNDINLNTRYS
jgi:hypothetical protein